MYAIVEMAGQQFKVAKDQKVYVHRLQEDEGKKVTFHSVLLIEDGKDITIGAPAIDGAAVEAKVVKHLKGDKVIVFKKKRRKGYQKKNGHRQYLTELVIESIVAKGAEKSSAAKAPDEKSQAKKAEPEKEEKAIKKGGKSAPVEVSVASKPEADKEAAKEAAKKAVAPKKEAKKTDAETKGGKEVEVSDNLITRAEHRVEDQKLEIDIDKLLHSIGTATKAEADDLKQINGIGPAYEKRLNKVGIYTYEQISKLKAADKDELAALDGITRDRIESEEWVRQAKELLRNK